MKFDQCHLRAFLKCVEPIVRDSVEQSPVGDAPIFRAQWLRQRGHSIPTDLLSALPTRRLDRRALARFVAKEPNVLVSFLAVMGWGQQNRRNLALAWANTDRLTGSLRQLRAGVETRTNAFDLFCLDRRIPGLGPAYFTKLIAFFRPELSGHILDQFTARSINLLSGQRGLVPMLGKHVAQSTSGLHYEAYCAAVDQLAAAVNGELSLRVPLDGSHVEFLLFGKSDRVHPWRLYLKANDGLG